MFGSSPTARNENFEDWTAEEHQAWTLWYSIPLVSATFLLEDLVLIMLSTQLLNRLSARKIIHWMKFVKAATMCMRYALSSADVDSIETLLREFVEGECF